MTSTFTKDEFRNIYDEYYNEILSYAYNRSPEKAHIENIADLVFIKAWEQIIGGAVIEDVRALLYEIADGLIHEKKNLYKDVMTFSILSSNRIIRHNPAF